MAVIKVGDVVGIPCSVQQGPFSEERLISFETVDGPTSGFVDERELKQSDGDWLVRATVRSVHDDVLEVLVQGSFFTTNGLANVPKRYAMAA